MIVSVSRRTDIPAWYADWFYARLRAGYADVRNPYRPRQVSRVSLTPEEADGFVFWTKNPLPMLGRLGELRDRAWYFQFTLTPYGRELEPGLPDKREVLIPAFRRLSELAGPGRVVWRYDPVVLTPSITPDTHRRCFPAMARLLEGATDECIVSFVDDYVCARRRMKQAGVSAPSADQAASLLNFFAETASQHGMRLSVCCEPSLLTTGYSFASKKGEEAQDDAIQIPGFDGPKSGRCSADKENLQGENTSLEQRIGWNKIAQARCIDTGRLARISGKAILAAPDGNQRKGCGCAKSVDIGAYDTCRSGCVYCYASHSAGRLAERFAQHETGSSLLYGRLKDDDEIIVRRVSR